MDKYSPENVIWQIVKFFAGQENNSPSAHVPSSSDKKEIHQKQASGGKARWVTFESGGLSEKNYD